jgi:hypothetical protein
MKYIVPVFIGVAVMTVGITTALAQYNHAYPLTAPYLYGYASALCLMIVAAVVAVRIAQQEHPMPRIVATRYGEGNVGTGIHSHGYPTGKSGVILVNDGEPAYEVGVYPPAVSLGRFKLCFENTIRRLTKEDGDAQLTAWIEQSNNVGILGDGLFEFMRQKGLTEAKIPIRYKGSNERWYVSVRRWPSRHPYK